ncbi:MAG: hypothetical protein ACOYOP_08105 [Microthrixaceae bacterium]
MRRLVAPLTVPVIALLVVAPFGLAACSSDSKSTTTTTTTEKPKNLSVSTPAGEVSLSLDGELPPNWPKDFPLPKDTDAAGSGSLGGSDKGVQVAVFTTKETGKNAFAFYTGNSSLNPTKPSSAGIGSAFAGSVDISGTYNGSVTVAGISDTTYIVVVLNTSGTGGGTTTTTTAKSGSTTTTTAGGSSTTSSSTSSTTTTTATTSTTNAG